MKYAYYLFMVLVPVALSAVSCSQGMYDVHRILAAADTVADTDLCAAMMMVDELDSMKTDMSRKEKAEYALLRTEVRYRLFLPVADDSLIFDAVRYFRRHGPDDRTGSALMMQGAVLYERGDWSGALQSYKEAERVMERAGDPVQSGLINVRIGEMYARTFVNSPEAVLRHRKALRYFEQTDDVARIASARLSLARVLLSDSAGVAERYVLEGLALAEMTGNKLWSLAGYELLSHCRMSDADYRGVVDVAMTAVDRYGWTSDDPAYSQLLGRILSNCVRAYCQLGQSDSANAVMQRIDWSLLPQYDSLLARCYMADAEKDWEVLARYRKQAWDLSDSLKDAGTRAMVYQAERLYDNSRSEAENDRLRYRMQITVIFIVSAVVCIAALILVLSLSLRKSRGSNRKYASENEMLRRRIDGSTPDKIHLETMGRMLAMTNSLIDTYYRYGNTASVGPKVRAILEEYFNADDKGKETVTAKVMELCDALYPGLIETVRQQYPQLRSKELLTISCTACGFSTGTTARLRGISEKSLYVERSHISSVLGCTIHEFIAGIRPGATE